MATKAERLARCESEIADAETRLRAGEEPIEGLLLKLMDWSISRRMILSENEGDE